MRGRGTLEKEKPPIFGMIQRGGEVVIRMVENVQQRTIEPLIKATIAFGTMFTLTNMLSITLYKIGAIHTKLFVMVRENMLEMKMVMVFVRFMSIQWKAFGRFCALGYDLIVVFLKKSYLCI